MYIFPVIADGNVSERQKTCGPKLKVHLNTKSLIAGPFEYTKHLKMLNYLNRCSESRTNTCERPL